VTTTANSQRAMREQLQKERSVITEIRPNRFATAMTGGCRRIAGPCVLVIFGVTGDLSTKKLMPAVYDLANRGSAAARLRSGRVRPARRGHTRTSPRLCTRCQEHAAHPVPRGGLAAALEGIRFVPVRSARRSIQTLAETIIDLDEARGTGGNHAFYLSIPPGCSRRWSINCAHTGWPRSIRQVEQGGDREAVRPRPGQRRELNRIVSSVFPSHSVFRIDHYLGKETVQNLMALRFANQLFEPVWNNSYVDHVQITMAEDIGIGGAPVTSTASASPAM
jgi:glucose-6-phosphate 1-dehydrogenase